MNHADAPVGAVMVATTTFKRTAGLAQLLDSFAALEEPGEGWRFDGLLVVDNDPAASAQEMVEQHYSHVNYFCESQPGIAAARNRAIAEAQALGADWIAFVDDDQTVTTSWLRELTSRAAAESASAVIGAVRFHNPPNTPDWFVGLGVFADQPVDQPDMKGYFSTNNLLLRIEPDPVEPPLFDERFGLTGGSDHHLGARMIAAGAHIAYAPQALAEENVLPERVNGTSAVKRILRYGNVLTRVDLAVAEETGRSQTRIRAHAALEGVAKVGVGVLRGLTRASGGAEGVMSGLRTSLIGIGQLYAAAGGVVTEYKRSSSKK